MTRRVAALPLAWLAVLAAPGPASAHGIHGRTAESVPDFVWLGIRHMVGGWDHLLFVVGVVVLAGGAVRAAKLISLFVAGHSATLLLATLAGWELNAGAVDVVIALSVAFIGLRIVRGRPDRWWWTGLAILGFGLVHGLGLATRLQEVDLPSGGALVARIVAFNLGVEIGQLIALTLVVGLGLLVARRVPDAAGAGQLLGRGLVAFGVLAAAALAFVAVRPGEDVYASGGPPCAEQPTVFRYGLPGGGHPHRAFFRPGERLPGEGDLQHVIRDGYIVVRYREDLPESARGALEGWVNESSGVFAVPADAAVDVQLETWQGGLACQAVDLQQLSIFRDSWRVRPIPG